MPTVKTLPFGTGAFIKSEGNGDISREAVTIVSGAGALLAGTVLGKITASGKYKPYDDDAADGTQTAVAILYADVDATSADVKATVIARNAEVWQERLVWGAAVTTAGEKTNAYADLATLGIIVRS